MPTNCFFLLTPDLKASSLISWLDNVINRSGPSLQANQTALANSTVALHKRVLHDMGQCWYEQISLLESSIDKTAYQQDINTIKENAATQTGIIHDSLLCYLLPLWQDSANTSKAVLYYNDPLQCALALQQRWRMPLSVGLALWENHIIEACKNLANQEAILLSHQHMIDSDGACIESVITELSGDSTLYATLQMQPLPTLNVGESPSLEMQATLKSCVQGCQTDLYELLNKGEINTIAKRTLSYASHNTLEYYGQLRAALEISNAERDSYKQQYIEQKNSAPQVNETLDETATPEVTDHVENNTPLCNVKVQIEGMDMLEFLAPIDSPILDMLQSNLVQTDNDELIYLNYGETGNEALYFMSSRLLSLETERV